MGCGCSCTPCMCATTSRLHASGVCAAQLAVPAACLKRACLLTEPIPRPVRHTSLARLSGSLPVWPCTGLKKRDCEPATASAVIVLGLPGSGCSRCLRGRAYVGWGVCATLAGDGCAPACMSVCTLCTGDWSSALQGTHACVCSGSGNECLWVLGSQYTLSRYVTTPALHTGRNQCMPHCGWPGACPGP
jgi:hypothetical protein